MELELEDYIRYGRQMIVPGVGKSGQLQLLSTSVAVVGAGGLGSSCLLYLAAAGVALTIIDDDTVSMSNLHRQVLHTSVTVGMPKVDSARIQLLKLNPSAKIHTVQSRVGPDNAIELLKDCNIIVDCTDNFPIRYLLNDVAVLTGKPLVSGSALQGYGQVAVFNYEGSPCYRCIFPNPPNLSGSCDDNGVFGPVTGVIGSFQAMEAIKVALKTDKADVLCNKLLMIDLLRGSSRQVRVSSPSESCQVCSKNACITLSLLQSFHSSMETHCTVSQPTDFDLSASAYFEWKQNKVPHILLDVRRAAHYSVCKLPDSINIPLSVLSEQKIEELMKMQSQDAPKETLPIVVLCRRGIDSVTAANKLLESGMSNVLNLKGGLQAWHNEVDSSFPLY